MEDSQDNQVSQADIAAADAARFVEVHNRIKAQIGRVIVGQESVIDAVLAALLAGGHVLLEGVPGLGKTILVRTLGEALDVEFSRIQFTPDMMPADVQGTNVLMESGDGAHELQFQKGPLIAQLVLADEINRATPKTQSALLEAMQEKQVTIGSRTIQLKEPYCVMATQNPVEQEGTYPLPEAQLDRFLFKVVVGYPDASDYSAILDRTTGTEGEHVESVSSGTEICELREVVRSVPVPQHTQAYAINLVIASQPGSDLSLPIVNESVSLGSSPRGAQGLILGAKVKALLAGRFAVATDDIRAVAHDVLRHRILVNFAGQADGVSPDNIVSAILEHVQPEGD